ncbi:MAG TPA: patatin-like phospholipase family protein [Allosphingosinicella sp.]|jgi:hypothetical protein|nr:patatin-like phospholipase family protein [Allosphingosinicella sp.]
MGALARLQTGWQRLREARGQLFDLCYELKWAIMTSILATAVLAAPGQVIELYRMLHSEGQASEDIFLAAPVVGMALVIWVATWIVADNCIERMASPARLTRLMSRLAPNALGALPLFGCAAGHFVARPKPLSEEVSAVLARAGSPWAGIAEDIAGDLGMRLPVYGLSLALVGAVVLAGGFSKRLRPKGLRWLGREAARPRGLLASFLLVAALCLLFTLSPVALPRGMGTFGIVALFFAAVAIITTQLTLLSIRYRFPVIPALLVLAAVTSILNLNDNHAIRRIDPVRPEPDPADVGAAFDDWYRSRPDLARFDGEYPVYIVAAQGGGIYAAYQTAVVLARLQDSCPAFRHHLFAISSVSGGSVGAAMFASALPQLPAAAPADTRCDRLLVPSAQPGPLERKVSEALTSDHLSPLVAATLFPDFTQRFLPFPIGPLDRARALEYSFEESAQAAGISRFARPFGEHWSIAGSGPALVMNTTDAASGARYLIAPFRLPQQRVPIAPAGQQPASTVGHFPFGKGRKDLRLSTAAVISARFPWLTPAALLPGEDDRPATRLVDGGYVDNSGLETALDIYEELRGREPAPGQSAPPAAAAGPRPRFIVIAITGGGLLTRNSFALGETLEPIRALLSTRVSRSYVALERAYRQMPMQEWRPIPLTAVRRSQVRTVGLSNRYYDLPLGWRLSDRTRRIIALQSGRGWDCEPGRYFHQAAPELAAADCVQALVSAEMNQRMDRFALETATLNYRFPGERNPPGQRFDYEAVLRCHSRTASRPLTYRQNRLAMTVMRQWDARPDLRDERWLAFALAALLVDSAGFETLAEQGTPEQIERRYGPGSSWGMRLGNTQPGDGWRYRGRGFLLLTGRSNYRRAGAAIGLRELEQNPDLFLSPEVSARYAFHLLFNDNRARLAQVFTSSSTDWTAAGRIVWGGIPGPAAQAAAEAVKFHGCLKSARREG